MTDMLMKIAAFGVMLGFVVILLIYVPRLDLGAVALIAVALAARDFFWRPRG